MTGVTITTRQSQLTELTHAQVDTNFINLKSAIDGSVGTSNANAAAITAFGQSGGSALIGNGGESVKDSFDALQLADYAALRAYAGPRASVYVVASGIAGMFVRRADLNPATTPDDGGTRIVGVAVWDRVFSGAASAMWFGAKGDGATDDTAAMASARAWLAVTRGKLVFPQGVYLYSVSPNWAIQHAEIMFDGDVRLRYTGTGNAVILDASASDAVVFVAGLCYGTRFGWGGRPIIEAPSTAGHGIYVRAMQRAKIGGRVRGCGTTSAGLQVEFGVCNEFDVPVSGNYDGWYVDSAGATAKPMYGYYLTRRNAGETTSYCTFVNPVVEGPSIGIYRHATLGNSFFGGTAEACGQYGTYGHTTSAQDRFYGTDFEVNTTADIYDLGDSSAYINCDTYTQLTVGSSSKNITVQGGRHKKILVDTGSQFATVSDVVYDRFANGTTFTDAGTGTILRNVRNSTGVQYLFGTLVQASTPVANNAQSVVNITVTGAKVGDIVTWSYDQVLPDALAYAAQASAANTVRLQATNTSGAQVTIPAGNWKVRLVRQ